MKAVRIIMRIIAYLIMLAVIGFVVWFALVNLNIIDNPYEKKIEMVSLSQSEIRLKRRNSFQLKATIYPEEARNGQVKYESDNEKVAIVNELTGYVTAKGNGIANITVSLLSNKNIKATCVVIVSDNNIQINEIVLNTKNINIKVGKTFSLNYKLKPENATLHDIEYISSDTDIATVDEKGIITGVSEGKAIITLSDKISGIRAEANVAVYEKEPDPTSVSTNPNKVTLTVGGSRQIGVTIKPKSANKNVTWQSLDDEIATVTSKGVITGKKVGTTKVVVTTVNGLTGYVDVKVASQSQTIKVTGIEAKEKNVTLNIGDSKTISYTIKPSNATNQGVSITSSDSEIVKVSGTKVTAMKEGNATITLTTNDGGYTDTVNVKVNKVTNIIEETGIDLTKTSVNLTVGGSETVSGKVLPANATYKGLTWTSSDKNVATVKDGLIVGKGKGRATITVTTAYKKISKTISVNVSEVAVTGVSLDKTSAALNIGETLSLVKTITPSNATNKSVTWKSSNTNVATVDNSGIVKAVAAGSATITVTTANGKSATCKITVSSSNIPATGISLNKQYVNTTPGDKIYITATVSPSNATNKTVTWTSSNNGVATVSDGVVETKGVGKATITATTHNGKSATCEVTVTSTEPVEVPVTSVSLNKSSISINVGASETLTATVKPDNATNKNITWTSSDNSVATVSNGKVVGVKAGSATITAKSNNGKTATAKVTVNTPPPSEVAVTSVSLNKTSLNIDVGGSKTLTATVKPDNATNKTVTWTSSDKSVATVSDGKVKGVKAGTATITAKSNNGKTATCKVTVNTPSDPEYTCAKGTYLKANETSCSNCESKYYCPGGTFKKKNAVQGRSDCPSGYTSDAKAKADTECYITVPAGQHKTSKKGTETEWCPAGTHSTTAPHKSYYNSADKCETCPANTYSSQGWGHCEPCPSGQTSPAGSASCSSPNDYTIKYNANGGSGSMASHTCTKDGSCTIKANGFTKSGYSFAGWTTKSDGTDDGYGWTGWSGTWKYTNGQYGIANNTLNLYARWDKASALVITKNANDYVNKAKQYIDSGCRLRTNPNYDGSTLKYLVADCGYKYVTMIWVKDANKQIHATGQIGTTKSGWDHDKIIQANAAYKGKPYIGFNASFFACVASVGGLQPCLHVIRRDGVDVATRTGELVPSGSPGSREYGTIGVSSSGELKYYTWGGDFNAHKGQMDSDGIRNTFAGGWKNTSFPASSASNSDKRTILCQIDNNNFAVYSGPGDISTVQYKMYQVFNCKVAFNMDGGHSVKVTYRTTAGYTTMYSQKNGNYEQGVADMMIFMEQ